MFLRFMSNYVGRDGEKDMHDPWSNGWSTNVNLAFDGLIPPEWQKGWRPASRWLGGNASSFHKLTKDGMSASSRYGAGEALRGCGGGWEDLNEVGMARTADRQVRPLPSGPIATRPLNCGKKIPAHENFLRPARPADLHRYRG